MNVNGIEMKILVNNGKRTIDEFNHEGEVFVEGRGGSKYVIQLTNNTNRRVEAVVSVDGLSVVDGKPAGNDSHGYLIEARETVKIPGWRLDDASVAAFSFVGRRNSYASNSPYGDAQNNGVIGVMAFSEAVANWSIGFPSKPEAIPYVSPNRPAWEDTWPDLPQRSAGLKSGETHIFAAGIGQGRSTAVGGFGGIETSMTASSTTNTPMSMCATGNIDPAATQSLGTGFGEELDHSTKEVAFKRGDLVALGVIYYDDAKGLKARGIDVTAKKIPAKPQAFPALAHPHIGCEPPLGYKRKVR